MFRGVVGQQGDLALLGVDMTQPEPFEAIARRVQHELWRLLEEEPIGGVRRLRELARRRLAAPATPVAPVVFTSNLGLGGGDWGDLGEVVWRVTQTPQVWLDNHVSEAGGGLLMEWDAVDALFEDGVQDAMFSACGALLTRLATAPQTWQQADLQLVPTEQLARRARANGQRRSPRWGGLACRLEAVVASAPRHEAVVCGDERVSYGALWSRAGGVAQALQDHAAGGVVGLVAPKGVAQAVAVIGAVRAAPPRQQHPVTAFPRKPRKFHRLSPQPHGPVEIQIY